MQKQIDIAETIGKAADAARLRGELKTRQDDDLRTVMGTEQGRRFIWDLLGDAGVYRTSFTGNSETFFNEGKRQIGLSILGRITEVCPAEYLKMQQEALSC
jgi:hypothetical protein